MEEVLKKGFSDILVLHCVVSGRSDTLIKVYIFDEISRNFTEIATINNGATLLALQHVIEDINGKTFCTFLMKY